MRPDSAPSTGLPPRHGPRGGPGTLPVVVQAPALEALRTVPGRSAAHPSEPAAPHRATTAHSGSAAAPTARREVVPPVPDIPEPPKPVRHAEEPTEARPHPVRPGARVPRELVRELPVRPADVCALGRRHGRWHPDSPEARICAGVHGG
ncbi:hypothetical protein [Streptomyces sp. Isolate_45]|uniref:hypothetical protein n=1 Tax=Streptomyces sp. Isolate_45 TaxID=2950111 RepID=UPI002481E9B3|nr:hypothetical protein [Streptomyces sp. Isolate_45]MDA5282611.1 hypothetical protein [Streptomyces sp. Isolate_45]